jgi:mono/diheme cytochrome c family protein/thiol-disulfide isomerase/thioredoxin
MSLKIMGVGVLGLSLVLGVGMGSADAGTAESGSGVIRPDYERAVGDFALKDPAGKVHRLSDHQGGKGVVVMFTGLGCPLSKLYTPRFLSIADRFSGKGVSFLMIDSNAQDSVADLAKAVKDFKITVPVLKDEGSRVADAFGVNRTNEVFLLDGDRRIQYHGAIDDQYGIGYQRPQADHHYLADAIEQHLSGQKIATARTAGVGCIIGRERTAKAGSKVTYHHQVERIFQQNCQACHRDGQIGPFALKTYEDAKGWAGMIKEVVSERRMPPWHADPKYGHFVNDRSLSKEEIDTIAAWVDAGSPKGNPADAPEPVAYPTGWLIGEPDAIVEMPEAFEVPAEGTVDYQYFPVKTNFDEDKWVVAGEVRAGAPSVVHHVLTVLMPPWYVERFFGKDADTKRLSETEIEAREEEIRKKEGRGDGGGGGLLSGDAGEMLALIGKLSKREKAAALNSFFLGNVPGQMPWVYPEGTAKLLPKGWVIVFQMHYTPNGKAVKDRTQIGLKFAKEEIRYPVRSEGPDFERLKIPPGEANYQVGTGFKVKKDMKVLAFLPHMHLRGKSFVYEVLYPDGREETVLSVPKYDFGWQIRYVLAEPLVLPKGTEIYCRATFDNSANNPWNPNPKEEVTWGDQTWEEMMIGFFDYVELEPLAAEGEQVSKADGAAD